MPLVGVGDLELCYELDGSPDEPVVVLVAGLGSSLATWDPRFVAMVREAGFAVLRFDNRDSGRSTVLEDAPPFDLRAAARGDRSVVTYTLDDLADDLAGLLDALGIDAAHVVGTSLGGMIAQTAAVRHPAKVRSLCSIMSTTGARDVGQARPEAAPVLVRPPAGDLDGFVAGELDNQRVIGSAAPAFVDEEWRRAKATRIWDHGVHPRGTGRLLMAIVASGDRTAALGAVRAPTVVIHGDADPLIDVSGGRATAAAIPEARLLVVPGLGHELPPAVWPEVVEAVADNARRADAGAGAGAGTGTVP